MDIQIGHMLQSSEIYGPGIRSVLWVQGCTLACKGCWNTQYWSANGGLTTTTKEILEQWKATQGLEGITLARWRAIATTRGSVSSHPRCQRARSYRVPLHRIQARRVYIYHAVMFQHE
jgi:hypothetical protein